MKIEKWCFVVIFFQGYVGVGWADTQIGGSAVTDSSFTMTGLVSISTLTANNISVSTMAAERALISDGSSVSPSLAFSNEQNTGFYRPGASLLGLTQSGNLKWTFGSEISSQNSATIIRNAAGSSSAPSYTFGGDENTGIYGDLSDSIRFAVGGIQVAKFSNAAFQMVQSTATIQNNDGSASLPSYTFGADTNTGIYRPATDAIGLSVNGGLQLQVDVNGTTVKNLILSNGTLANNANVTGKSYMVYSGSALTLNGLSGGNTNQLLFIYNIDSINSVTIKNNNAGGTQKFLTPGAADYILTARTGATAIFDGSGFWVIVEK